MGRSNAQLQIFLTIMQTFIETFLLIFCRNSYSFYCTFPIQRIPLCVCEEYWEPLNYLNFSLHSRWCLRWLADACLRIKSLLLHGVNFNILCEHSANAAEYVRLVRCTFCNDEELGVKIPWSTSADSALRLCDDATLLEGHYCICCVWHGNLLRATAFVWVPCLCMLGLQFNCKGGSAMSFDPIAFRKSIWWDSFWPHFICRKMPRN